MNRRHIIVVSSAIVGALALTGCTSGTKPAPNATPTSTASSAAATDAATCTGFNDVLTITANADAGLRDGRMAAQERQGWYQLATRVLDGVPTRGDGLVSEATAALKNVAPAIKIGAIETTGIGSAEWTSGLEQLYDACAKVGVEASVDMFTGG